MRNSLQKEVDSTFSFAGRTSLHYPVTLFTVFYLLLYFLSHSFLQILCLCQNTLTFLNGMMLGVMAKKGKNESENEQYGYRQEKTCFLLQRSKTIAFYLHLRNAEQLFTA